MLTKLIWASSVNNTKVTGYLQNCGIRKKIWCFSNTCWQWRRGRNRKSSFGDQVIEAFTSVFNDGEENWDIQTLRELHWINTWTWWVLIWNIILPSNQYGLDLVVVEEISWKYVDEVQLLVRVKIFAKIVPGIKLCEEYSKVFALTKILMFFLKCGV